MRSFGTALALALLSSVVVGADQSSPSPAALASATKGAPAQRRDAPAPRSAGQQEVFLTIAGANQADADGTTALHWAVQSNDVGRVQQLIRAGANVKTANRYGVTPLSLAAINGSSAVVSALLRAGADANTVTGEGETVLMTAARAGHDGVVKQLLAAGADPNARERWLGQTALMWAAAENHPAAIETLLQKGADPNASANVLEYHAMQPSENATPKVTAAKGGMVPLHYAAREGALDAVRALASAPGTDLNQADPDGETPLLYAALNGHYDTAAFLLEKGADPNLADVYGRTVLYVALDLNRAEWNPRPSPKTNDRVRPLDLVKLVLARGANPNAPITGRVPGRCAQGCEDASAEGATPIWRAARSSDVEAVRILLAAGADPMMPTRDGTLALMTAAGRGWSEARSIGTQDESIDTIKLLLQAGVDVNATNNQGETALHGAAGRGADTVVQFLADNGASLAAKDRANRTALDVAMGVPAQAPRPGDYNEPKIKESTAKLLRELMATKGVAIDPYTRPANARSEAQAQ